MNANLALGLVVTGSILVARTIDGLVGIAADRISSSRAKDKKDPEGKAPDVESTTRSGGKVED